MTAPGLPIIVATNGFGLPVTVVTNGRGVPVQTSTNGRGIPVVVKASGGLPVQYVDAINIFAGLPWIAGAFTVLSTPLPYERGTVSGGTNPRFFKHPTTLINGRQYRLRGLARSENDASTFFRVSTTSALSADGPVNFAFTTPQLLDITFTAAATGYFIGGVIISDATHTYLELEDAFSLTLV